MTAIPSGPIGDQPGYVSVEIEVGKPEGEATLDKVATGRKEVLRILTCRRSQGRKTGAEGDGIEGATSLGRRGEGLSTRETDMA